MGFKRKKKPNIEITLSDGVVMKQPLQMETSSWLRNCMVKSLLVFSVIFGCLGCFLSSFDVEFYVIPTAAILFGMALLFTTIYYRGWLMDAVYVVFLVIFFFLVQGLQVYINSGYYLIINRIFETVEFYFDLPGMQYYEIAAANEVLAASVIVIFIGTVMMIVANVIISRTMNVWFLLVMTGLFWIVPMYFRLEPDALYVILMLAGYLAVWAIHSSGAYGMDRKHRDYKWKDKKGKKLRIWYVQDAATMLETIGVFAAVVLLLYGITSVAGDKDTFNLRYRQNPQKEESEEMVQQIATRGFSVFNRYDATGGISGGQLGGVASVSPDYQTDLVVRFTPYSYEPVYLKGFVGVDYVSAESRWLTYEEKEDNPYYSALTKEENTLSQEERELLAYGEVVETSVLRFQHQFSAKNDLYAGSEGRMLIHNVGANENYPYAPYYTFSSIDRNDYIPSDYQDDTVFYRYLLSDANWGSDTLEEGALNIVNGKITRNEWADYVYYPIIESEKKTYGVPSTMVDIEKTVKLQAETFYLDVPEECYDAVTKASEEAGIVEGDSQEVIIQKVKDYFEEEFSYTTRPGRTPRGEDFVTWFLEKKKGYCAHFATAATMIYRYNGIPARYVEGYVITYEDVMNGELLDDFDYDDYYSGDSELGETGVVEVAVTDARAHAWVEVYQIKEEYADVGFWTCEEVTTAAVEPEEETENFWDIFGNGNNNEEEMTDDTPFYLNTMNLDLDDIQGIWIGLIIVLVLLILFYGGRKGYQSYREYQSWHTENGNENVIAYYHIISKRLRKKSPAYAQCPTYQKQLGFMAEHLEGWNWDIETLAELLETANYSKNGISDFDCKRVMLELADIEKKVKKWKDSKMRKHSKK